MASNISIHTLASLHYNQQPHALARLWAHEHQGINPLDVIDKWSALERPRSSLAFAWFLVFTSFLLFFFVSGITQALLDPGARVSTLTIVLFVPMLIAVGMLSKYRDPTVNESALERSTDDFVFDLNKACSLLQSNLASVAPFSEEQLRAASASLLSNAALGVLRTEVSGWQTNPEMNMVHATKLKELHDTYDFLKDAFGLVPSGGVGPYFKVAEQLLAGDGSARDVPTEGYPRTVPVG